MHAVDVIRHRHDETQYDARFSAMISSCVGHDARIDRALLVGLLLNGIVRVGFALAAPIVQVSDYLTYYNDARGYAGLLGAEFRPTIGNVGQKLFYAACFRLFGDGLRVIGLANAALALLALTCLSLATRRVFGVATARLVPWVCLASLSELYFNNLACTEALATVFVAALILALGGGVGDWRRVIAVGCLGGLACWNRSNLLGLGAFVFAWEWHRTRAPKAAFGRALGVQALLLVVTVPLAWLNLRAFGSLTPVAASSEENLWYGNNPRATPAGHAYAPIPEQWEVGTPERAQLQAEYAGFYVNPDQHAVLRALGPVEASRLKMRYALAFIHSHPVRYLELSAGRLQRMLSHCTFGAAPYLYYDPRAERQPRWRRWVRRAILGTAPTRRPGGPDLPIPAQVRFTDRWYRFLAVLAAGGLAFTVARGRWRSVRGDQLMPLAFAVFYVLPFALTYAHNRYKVPVMCIMWVYLAHGLVLAAD